MVRLVPIETDVILVVLLVNMQLIKGTYYFPMWPGWVQGNSDGPLVPIENDVIPMALLVNMHVIKGTWIIFPCDLAG